MSTESFSFLRTADEQQTLRNFLAQTEREIMTLVVFRQDAAWRESWENQRRFNPANYDTIMHQPDDLRINADWFYDTSAIHVFWAPFNLTDLTYAAHDNIFETLFQTMCVTTTDLKTDMRANTRKTGMLLDQTEHDR